MRASMTRFSAAEGVAGSVDRLSGGASTDDLRKVADAYANAADAQKTSAPPASAAKVSALLTTYYQYMSDNWNGWISNSYVSVHDYLALRKLADQLHAAETALQTHCS